MMRTLQDYLETMAQFAGRAELLLATAPHDLSTLLRLRMEQARVMMSYQLFVHRELFEPLLKNGIASDIATVKELKVECILLAEDFRAHTRTWSERSPETEWPEYQKAAKGMIDRIGAHVANIRRNPTLLAWPRADNPAWQAAARSGCGEGARVF